MVLYKQDTESVSMNRVMNRIFNRISKWLFPEAHVVQPTQAVVERTRLREDQYQSLEKRMVPPMVSTTTTDLQAGYALGVQAVLKELRDGFVA